MRLGLIGTVMHDVIQTLDGQSFESFGGITYNLMALAAVTTAQDRIHPFAFLSAEHLGELRARYLDRLPAVDPGGLQAHPAGTDRNQLWYVTASSRREVMRVVTPPLAMADLPGIGACDGVLVNFINGSEMELPAFQELRRAVRGPIYLDVHNLGKLRRDGVPVPGHRFQGWPEWFACVDVVQGNEWEAERLLDFHPHSEADYQRAALLFLSVEGPRIAVLTVGGEGCAIAWREGDGVRFLRIPGMAGIRIVDTTGCGDSFSAAFLVEYLRTGCPLRSGVFAATVSGLNCQAKGLAALENLGDVRGVMQQAYAGLLERIAGGYRGEAVEPLRR